MTDEISILLTSFAVYSNLFAIITVVLTFIVMTVCIIRLNNGIHFPRRGGNITQNAAVEKPIVCQSNPFSIKLSEVLQSSLKDGLAVHVSSLCQGNLSVFWGPEIESVFSSMIQNANIFLRDLEQGKYLEDKCLHYEYVKRLEFNESLDITIPCPGDVEENDLGQAPRKRYSCVLIAAVSNSSLCYGNNIIASITIIHLKDSLVRMGSHIMNQYIKTGDGRVFSLRPLYMARSHDNSADNDTNHSARSENNTEREISEFQQPSSSDNILHSANTILQEPSDNNQCTSKHPNDLNTSNEPQMLDINNTSGSAKSNNIPGTSNVTDGISSDDDPNIDDSSEDTGSEFNFPECIVCQTRPQSHALLPCRHACVCQVCLRQLTRCPMCRASIESYFRLFDFVDEVSDEIETPAVVDFTSWVFDLNRRLNEYLGFT